MPTGFHIELQGIEVMRAKLFTGIEKKREKLRRALDSVLIEFVNFIKTEGPWKDRTGVLRNSISYQKSEWTNGNTLRGSVFAGAEYAIFVEFREGYWVISGPFAEYRDKVLGMIVKNLSEQE